MVKRILELLINKIKGIFLHSISFSSRIEFSVISRKAKVWGNCKIFHSKIGECSYVGPNSRLIYTNVGKFCSIAANSIIGMGSHTLEYISTSSIFTSTHNGVGLSWTKKDFFVEYKTTSIGNDVWIGQRAMVMSGVAVGDGAVIGAGAIVTKDVPPYAIVAGVPAKIIRYRFPDEVVNKLEALKWWDLPLNVLKTNIALFQSSDMDNVVNVMSKL